MNHGVDISNNFLNEIMAESVVVQVNPQQKVLNEREEKVSLKDQYWMLLQNNDTSSLELPKMNKHSTQVVEEVDNPKSYLWEGGPVPNVISVANSVGNQSFFNEQQIQCVQLKLVREKNQPNKIYEKEGHGKIVTVGRGAKNDLIINDQLCSISSFHAEISWDEEKKGWFLSDSNSRNGSFLVIDNSQVREKDTLAIGLHLCSIRELTFGLTSCSLKLEFSNMADDSIESVEITAEIKDEDRFFIGKAHQQNLSEDPMLANNQFYFTWESQKRRLKVFQCEDAPFPISKAVKPGKKVLLKNNDTIRFGLMNFYSFLAFSKIFKPPAGKGNSTSSDEECLICFETKKKICVLNPCNHSGICMDCVIRICECPVQKCPFCNALFDDFIEKKLK